jgi:hypothetical protein
MEYNFLIGGKRRLFWTGPQLFPQAVSLPLGPFGSEHLFRSDKIKVFNISHFAS